MTSDDDRLGLVRDLYDAWLHADRDVAERVLHDELRFSAPPDPLLDRAGYFERCWPGAGQNAGAFQFLRLLTAGDDVLVTYVATRHDGTRFQNTELFGFAGDRIARIEVYFGWELGAGAE